MFGAFTPEDVERFRGPQHCLIWADELAAWRKLDEAWDMLQYGLRLGENPHVVATTTPKRRPKLIELLGEATTVVSRARTADNLHLPESRRDALYARYGGTTLGRQELDAEILDDVVGALWNRKLIVYRPNPKIMRHGVIESDMLRVVVAIDPAVTSTEDSDETGIVVDGVGVDGNGYTLADLSGRMAPVDWARRAIRAYHDFGAERIVAEANNGGDLVSTVIAQLDPMVPVTLVHAAKGKIARAQPIAMLYEQSRWFHVEPFPELEDQMCSFTGEPGSDSPDRLDAHVWAASDLFGVGDKSWGSGSWGGAIGAGTA
jgi:phage terminase large subunit-like protein